MLSGQRIFVVVPAFREGRLIKKTLTSVPSYVDGVIVVDDASDDDTGERARELGDPRVRVVRHRQNQGVGAAIRSGYLEALGERADAVAVMAGDAQMDPDDLAAVLAPVLGGTADYVKGNRFVHAARRDMPLPRRAAGSALSFATRLATGLDVDDCQCGFTCISAGALRALPLGELWPRYGYPNDLLGLIAGRGLTVTEVPVRPVYGSEASGVRPWHALLILGLIARRALLERVRSHPLDIARAGYEDSARSTMRSA